MHITHSRTAYFNPRSPHGERRRLAGNRQRAGGFQSTLPARGATAFPCLAARAYSNFNPRSPHGERLFVRKRKYAQIDFNPRSPHGERQLALDAGGVRTIFQSTLPARGATRNAGLYYRSCNISIHAPRTGSDWPNTNPPSVSPISIHAPRTGSDGRSKNDKKRWE